MQTKTTHNHATPTESVIRCRLMALMVAVVAIATACGGGERPELSVEPTTPPTTVAVASQPEEVENGGEETAVGEVAAAPTQRAISLVETLVAYEAPGSDVMVAALDNTTEFGSARVLLVEEVAGDWIRVQLPVRPNATSGWVSAAEVSLETIPYSVLVDLERRQLQVLHNGTLVLQTEVAVGSEANPTPIGTFFVTDKLSTPDPDGAYGPFALGLSGFSETLTEFAGGDGQVGLHGTNDPSSIGQNVSHGCVRLANDVIVELAEMLPLGTPVTVA